MNSLPEAEVELEILAIMVHGALAALHALGAAYNIRQKNKWDALIHAAACAYDIRAAFNHYRKVS